MTATAPADDKVDPKVIKTGLILVVGFIAVVFDTTIVSVALHTLSTQLHTSVSTIQWVTTGYLLALGMAVPLSTWALRRFGGSGCGCSRWPCSWSGRSAPAWPGTSTP